MKKSYILFSSFLISLSFMSLFVFLSFYTSYIPRYSNDVYKYTQAKILLNDTKELSKYFLYLSIQKNEKEPKNINFKYPNDNTIINIDYFYPKDKKYAIINSSVFIKNYNVNEEIYLNKKFIIYLDQEKS